MGRISCYSPGRMVLFVRPGQLEPVWPLLHACSLDGSCSIPVRPEGLAGFLLVRSRQLRSPQAERTPRMFCYH